MPNLRKYAFLTGLLLFLAGLALFAYLGVYNRYWADDWCYSADLKELGFLGTLKGYWYITTYAANRFSLTLFSGVINFFGVFGVQMMTPVFIILWMIGLYWIAENLRKLLFKGLFTRIQTLFVTAIIIYYSIYLTPHVYQSIYWRSGLLPYTAPVVFGVWVFALLTFRIRQSKPSIWLTVLTATIAFLAGGFSEAGCATLISTLVVYSFVCYINREREWAKSSMPAALVTLFAATLAMVLLIVSPTVLYRLGLYDEKSLSLLEFSSTLIHYTFDFIKYTFLDAPLPNSVFVLTLGCAGFLSNSLIHGHLEKRTLLVSLLLIVFLTFLFVAASYAPSTLIEKSPPAPRTRIISLFVLYLGVSAFVGILGYYAKQIFAHQAFEIMAVILLAALYVYDVRTVVLVTDKVSVYSERARVWDERDSQIAQANEQGILEVNVRAIDGKPVKGIRDFIEGPGVGFWINRCAARYYDVEAIYATGP